MQITDIFAECSIDYDPKSQVTKDFFATVQNKFHYAITGQTAAEIIDAKVNKSEPFMGLTTWKNYSFVSSPSLRVFSFKLSKASSKGITKTNSHQRAVKKVTEEMKK